MTIARADHGWEITRADFEARWDERTRVLDLAYAGEAAYLSSCLRVFLAAHLRSHHGALVHSSGVRVGERAVIFPGVSGTGKTTIATLAAPRPILSDEIIGLRVHENDLVAYPTPFWGDMPRTRAGDAAKVAAIALIRRSNEPSEGARVTESSSAEALAALLQGGLFFGDEHDAKAQLFHILSEMALKAPCFEVRYQLPIDPWPAIEDSLRSHF